MQSLKKKTEGFTIIEVMIVLVIAAVIILIVFLAVPALQRNSRNNQRRSDVSRALAAVTEYANNNNGDLPTTGSAQATAAENVELGYYTGITWSNGNQTNDDNTETLEVVLNATCNDADATGSPNGRRFVALYAVETGGDSAPVCTES